MIRLTLDVNVPVVGHGSVGLAMMSLATTGLAECHVPKSAISQPRGMPTLQAKGGCWLM